jgi:hypothetical protein
MSLELGRCGGSQNDLKRVLSILERGMRRIPCVEGRYILDPPPEWGSY